jgi:hypothetical protein
MVLKESDFFDWFQEQAQGCICLLFVVLSIQHGVNSVKLSSLTTILIYFQTHINAQNTIKILELYLYIFQ